MFTGFVAIFIFPTVKDGIIAFCVSLDNGKIKDIDGNCRGMEKIK